MISFKYDYIFIESKKKERKTTENYNNHLCGYKFISISKCNNQIEQKYLCKYFKMNKLVADRDSTNIV